MSFLTGFLTGALERRNSNVDREKENLREDVKAQMKYFQETALPAYMKQKEAAKSIKRYSNIASSRAGFQVSPAQMQTLMMRATDKDGNVDQDKLFRLVDQLKPPASGARREDPFMGQSGGAEDPSMAENAPVEGGMQQEQPAPTQEVSPGGPSYGIAQDGLSALNVDPRLESQYDSDFGGVSLRELITGEMDSRTRNQHIIRGLAEQSGFSEDTVRSIMQAVASEQGLDPEEFATVEVPDDPQAEFDRQLGNYKSAAEIIDPGMFETQEDYAAFIQQLESDPQGAFENANFLTELDKAKAQFLLDSQLEGIKASLKEGTEGGMKNTDIRGVDDDIFNNITKGLYLDNIEVTESGGFVMRNMQGSDRERASNLIGSMARLGSRAIAQTQDLASYGQNAAIEYTTQVGNIIRAGERISPDDLQGHANAIRAAITTATRLGNGSVAPREVAQIYLQHNGLMDREAELLQLMQPNAQ